MEKASLALPVGGRPAALGRELLAAAGAAGVQHLAATGGGHARAETMAALANELARLIGALHGRQAPKGGFMPEKSGVFRGPDPACQRRRCLPDLGPD